MFIDRLIEKIKQTNNPSVVGLDPRPEFIPEHILQQARAQEGNPFDAIGRAFFEFNRQIIDAIADVVPCVKPQLACYEAIGLPGMLAFEKTVRYAQKNGLLVIADGKRNDIGSSAEGYAQGFIENTAFACDALTVNPYLGVDGIEPFVNSCNTYRTGIFVLAKTSNPSSGQLQDLLLQSGESVAEKVAALINEWGHNLIGINNYSSVGAVVGATYPEQAEKLRAIMPHAYILVPGYGAQGGSAKSILPNFNRDGLGAIVNASRSIMLAHKSAIWRNQFTAVQFAAAARAEALRMRDEIVLALEEL
ncbi:MAG: orotidine-5'-phosphate decarboxylase [Negativicutes bacterium]|jgi:orotidine-5'-phosphate decarboxylase